VAAETSAQARARRWSNVALGRERLRNQQIERPAFERPADVVRWFGAVQAQDPVDSLWAVGLRTRSATRRTVEDAIASGEIVRTWPMRRTLHYVAADDIHWMLALLTPRVLANSRSRYRELELDERTLARAERVALRALAGGRRLTRRALYDAWNAAKIESGGGRGLHIVSHLALRGIVCFGPREGAQPTFTLLSEWVPNAKTLDRPAALAVLARRYFTSHGPAQLQDFVWWSGLPVADARAGIEGAAAHLAREAFAGATFWRAAGPPAAGRGSGTVPLLPVLDEYTVAYRDRSAVLPPQRTRLVNSGGGILRPIIVRDGQVVGAWRREVTPGMLRISCTPFTRPSAAERAAVERAAERVAQFFGLTLQVST
jgi:hypothetical protein